MALVLVLASALMGTVMDNMINRRVDVKDDPTRETEPVRGRERGTRTKLLFGMKCQRELFALETVFAVAFAVVDVDQEKEEE